MRTLLQCLQDFSRLTGLVVIGAVLMLAALPGLGKDSALDLDGKPFDPLAATNATAHVLVFVARECPISNRYAPELRRLHEKFAPRGVKFWFVYPDADTTAEQARQHGKEFDLPGGALRDPKHALVRQSKVKVTPEAALFTGAGRLAYHGRIDDWYVDFGKARPAPTQRDLHDAIEAVLKGKKPKNASTRAVGCAIP